MLIFNCRRASAPNSCIQGSTVYPKQLKAGIQTGISTPMFTAALFSMVETTVSINKRMDKQSVVYILHKGILFSHKKELNA